jgi:acetylornithine deacetylase/succinyl-diaminopimelate desuccinylase-like protein
MTRDDAQTVAEQCTIAAIASPPFGEAARAEWMRERFTDIGLQRVRIDDAGNVIAECAGTQDVPPVIVAAHLDTVFPAGTILDLRRQDGRVLLPGIADNARGLAGVLAIARALVESGIVTEHPIHFVATVGEEGVGDLRGVKHLFRDGASHRNAHAFIALDGTETRRIVNRAVGSRRFRIAVRGPGGHSWADRNAPNPAWVLGHIMSTIGRLRFPAEPPWSLNIGRVGGGTSVNAIPEEVWFELDMRSEDGSTLATVETTTLRTIRQAAAESNAMRRGSTTQLELDVQSIGNRPAGGTPADARLVQIARAATRYIGRRPELVASSTDANVPMALGIPAIAIGAGGESGGMHTLSEWYDNRRGAEGLVRAALTVVAAAS